MLVLLYSYSYLYQEICMKPHYDFMAKLRRQKLCFKVCSKDGI